MKKAFSVLLFSFISISFVYEGHATFGRGLMNLMEGSSRISALSKAVRALSLEQSAPTTDSTSMSSGMTGQLFDASLVPTGQSSLLHAVKGMTAITLPAPYASPTSDVFQGQSSPFNEVSGIPTIKPTATPASFLTPSVWAEISKMSVKTLDQITAQDLPDSGAGGGVSDKAFADGVFPELSLNSLVTQLRKVATRMMSWMPKKYDLSYGQLSESLPWAKILWSADMLRLESQESGWAKAAFKVAAHHAVQYATSSLVDAAIGPFCPSLDPVSFSLSSARSLSWAVVQYAVYGSFTVNPLGLSATSALQVAHFAYQNPEYVYMTGQVINKTTTLASSWCGNPVIGLVTGGVGPLAASVADLGSSFVGDALKGASRGVMNFNAMLVEKSVTWLMSGASTVYSKLWAAPATEPVPAYA